MISSEDYRARIGLFNVNGRKRRERGRVDHGGGSHLGLGNIDNLYVL